MDDSISSSSAPDRAAPLSGQVESTTDTIGHHPINFTGDGGEYFRVWIVNVLLSIVTLGIYTPWARRRTVKYFYSHTEVADGPLEFTAKTRSMVVGFLLLAVIYAAINVASETGHDVVVGLAMLGGVALAPWLWGKAMRFRLGNTRWRGLRLQFGASWAEVYRASWPVFALVGLWVVLGFLLALLAPEVADLAGGAATGAAEGKVPTPEITAPMGILLFLGLATSFVLLTRLDYNYKVLLVRRTLIGDQAGRWHPGFGAFLRIALASLGVFLLSAVLVTLAMMLLGALFGGVQVLMGGTGGSRAAMVIKAILIGTVIGLAGFFLSISPALAYREARMFQLLWNGVGVSRIARFRTSLGTSAFVWLRIKNVLLTVITLGFYRPFARVNEYRMKAESTMLYLKGGVEPLVSQLTRRQEQGGFGDAVADALGLDLVG
ncbi:YjgN family protein [Variovorax sp. LARHSF232]